MSEAAPEKIYAIRRTDGESLGDDWSFLVVGDASDWQPAEDDAEYSMADPMSVEYELIEMTVRSLGTRRLPPNPHVKHGDQCEYCGEDWPCEWMQANPVGVSGE